MCIWYYSNDMIADPVYATCDNMLPPYYWLTCLLKLHMVYVPVMSLFESIVQSLLVVPLKLNWL